MYAAIWLVRSRHPQRSLDSSGPTKISKSPSEEATTTTTTTSHEQGSGLGSWRSRWKRPVLDLNNFFPTCNKIGRPQLSYTCA
ncbi:hypothetical protein RSAG8_08381, partial [Rhizoctonia solani AG-8 WAC10335]